MSALHGGQVTATKWHYFEVVYTPRETRIYVYSPSQRPLGAGGVRGEVVMQVNGNPKQFRFPVKEATDSSGMVYLSVVVDVSRVRDNDMQVAFDFERLPFREERRARFNQTFALAGSPLQVTVARLVDADRPLIDRQRMCPVMDAELASHGQPIKLLIGDRPLFVCCEGCIAEVREKPAFYLQKTAAAMQQRQPPRPQISVSYATRDDQRAIEAQRNCPVMGQPLGQHGTPIKVVVDARTIFVCCRGCIEKVTQNPEVYFRRLAAADRPSERPAQQRQISVSYATAADQTAIRAQGRCPVMNQPLGGHGKPIKILIDGRPVFVCCKGCIAKVQQNPDDYLAKIAGSRPAR